MEDVALFKPLMDFAGVEPLDCVGDKTEVWVCLELLMQQGLDNPVITYYRTHIRPEIESELPEYIHQIRSIQRVPLSCPQDLMHIFQETLDHVVCTSV